MPKSNRNSHQNPPRSEPLAPSTTAQNGKTTTGITSARIAHISHTDPNQPNHPPKLGPRKFPNSRVIQQQKPTPRSKFRRKSDGGMYLERGLVRGHGCGVRPFQPWIRLSSLCRRPVGEMSCGVPPPSLSVFSYLWLVSPPRPERCVVSCDGWKGRRPDGWGPGDSGKAPTAGITYYKGQLVGAHGA
jgi:hypothetical protein